MSVDDSQLAALVVRFDQAGPRVSAGIDVAVRKTAADVERTGKELAAVDTGAMRASIGTDVEGSAREGNVEAVVGPTVEYAPYVEYGTYKMSPQPFMGPALDQNGYKLEAAIAQLTGKLL